MTINESMSSKQISARIEKEKAICKAQRSAFNEFRIVSTKEKRELQGALAQSEHDLVQVRKSLVVSSLLAYFKRMYVYICVFWLSGDYGVYIGSIRR